MECQKTKKKPLSTLKNLLKVDFLTLSMHWGYFIKQVLEFLKICKKQKSGFENMQTLEILWRKKN